MHQGFSLQRGRERGRRRILLNMFCFWFLLCLMTTGCFGNSALCGKKIKKLYGTLGHSLDFVQLNLEAGSESLVISTENGNQRMKKLRYDLKTKKVALNESRFQYNESNSTVFLQQLQRGDEGVYEITLESSRTDFFCKFDLKVYEQISHLSVSITHGFQNASCVGTLNCLMKTGDNVTFSWTQDEKTLGHNSSTLVIDVTPDNDNSSYTCTAKNPVSERSSTLRLPETCSTTQVKSTVNFDPKYIYIISAAASIILVIALVFITKVCLSKIGNSTVHPTISPNRPLAPEPTPESTHQATSTIYCKVQKRETLRSNVTATEDKISTVYELAGPSNGIP